MTSKSNRVGFGFDAFGGFKWGWGDWSEVMLWNFLPRIYRQTDASRTNQELRGWIDSIKSTLQDHREAIEFFSDLRDPLSIKESLIEVLAADFGLVDDKSNVEERRRAILFNVFQLYLNKGTEEGYRIIGAFTNVDATVQGLWENPCASGTTQTAGPSSFTLRYDEVPIDEFDGMFDDFFTVGGETLLTLRFNAATEVSLISIDEVKNITTETVLSLGPDYSEDLVAGTVTLAVPASASEQYRVLMTVNIPADVYVTDEFALWPLPVEDADDICRTNRLILNLSRIPGAVSEIPASLDEIIAKIEEFKPAHVVFDRVDYDVEIPVSMSPVVTLETL